MTAPRVTVLMSVYNDAPFLRAAVDSILAQTYRQFEFLIINDGSDDDSRAILDSYCDPRIRILDNDVNRGLTWSLNRGLSDARGELVARLDGNDISFPERLRMQVEFLDAHPDVAVVGVQAQIIDVRGRRLRRAELRRPASALGVMWLQMFSSPLLHPGTMYRRSVVWQELGGYDPSFRVGQDAELWFRVVTRYRITNLPEQLLAMRSDRRSISGNPGASIRAGHRERWIPLFRESMRRALRMDVPEDWPSTWVDLFYPHEGSDREASVVFPEILHHHIYRRFVEVHPDAAFDPDVATWRAQFLSLAAARSANTSRMRSVRALGRAIAADPAHAIPRVGRWISAMMKPEPR